MTDHPHAVLYRKALEAFASGDTEAVMTLIADDVVWHYIAGDEPYRGREEMLEAMKALEGAEFDLDIHDVVAGDEHTVALVEATVRAGGDEFTYRTAEILHVEDGKVKERWAFSDDTQAIADFFARLTQS